MLMTITNNRYLILDICEKSILTYLKISTGDPNGKC